MHADNYVQFNSYTRTFTLNNNFAMTLDVSILVIALIISHLAVKLLNFCLKFNGKKRFMQISQNFDISLSLSITLFRRFLRITKNPFAFLESNELY